VADERVALLVCLLYCSTRSHKFDTNISADREPEEVMMKTSLIQAAKVGEGGSESRPSST
jgi:hypothetical protein